MRASRRVVPLLIATVTTTLIAGGLVGCGNSPSAESASTDVDSGGGDSAGDGDAEFPRKVKAANGTATIESKPKRVVALDPSFIDNSLLLGTDVVGYASYRSVQTDLPDYLGGARQRHASEAKSVGTIEEPKLEQIAALKPDLILTAKVRHEAIADKLAAIAPTVMAETTGPTWKANLELAAEALGEEDKAEQAIAAYEKRAKAIGDEINAKEKDPTVSIVRFVDGPTRLYANASYPGIVLQDAGLARPSVQDVDEFSVDISEERILDADADHIFVTTYTAGGPSATKTKEKFQRNPLWGQLKGELHDAEDAIWMTPCSMQGAHAILDNLASTFDVAPHR